MTDYFSLELMENVIEKGYHIIKLPEEYLLKTVLTVLQTFKEHDLPVRIDVALENGIYDLAVKRKF
jgi:hypothetical protein